MRFVLSLCAALCLPGPLTAQGSDPALVSAIQLADQGDFPAAFEQLGVTDRLGRSLLTWLQLRDGQGDFAAYVAFLNDHPEWPAQDRLRAQAERAIEKGHNPEAVIGWFGDTAPRTGIGAVRLAEALTVRGELEEAKRVVRTAWTDLRLTEDAQEALLAGFGDVLEPYHALRVDNLLWRWRTTEAKAMMPLLSDDLAAMTAARIAYITDSGVAEAVAKVPEDLQDTTALAYDRYSWLSDNGNWTEAVALLKAKSTSAEALQEPFRWSGWRRTLARWEMREGRAQSAYDLASQHFLSEGSAFVDLEWLAGYIALQYLDDAPRALAHFQTFQAASEGPISQGRAGYWLGRAHAATGDDNAAAAAYANGAKHQTSFYGLLAAEQLGMRLDPSLTGRADMVDWQGSDIARDDFVIAALALLEAGERGSATLFFSELGRRLDGADTGRLAQMMADFDDPYYSILLGKAAARRGIIVPSAYFPLHDLIDMDLPAEPALSLSIARRESEFNFRAGSPVGALGLMQLMPATAEEVAGFLDLPFSRGRLTSDWRYNAQLGARYLAELEGQFGPSPVQIAAGYNAGPSRPLRWMDERGDPRLGEVDVVDWIEHIPFRETRNYVMRVSESIPVYRARLSGETGPVAFTRLLLGKKPVVRPQIRPDRPFIAPEPVVSEDRVTPKTTRPTPRPGE